MNKPLTEKESKIADLFLHFLLTLEKNSAFKSIVNTFFIKHNVNKERTLFICKYLERKTLVTIMLDSNDELRNLNFDTLKIKDFIKNESINKIWLTENKLYNDSKLSERQVKTFYIVFAFGLFGGLYSCYDFIKNLTKEENDQQKQITKEELESELSKLRTLILTQKKDSLLNVSNSERGK
jgi:hypothetical protein